MVTWRRIVSGTALAASVFICLDGQAGEARDVRELKVAAFERRGVSVGLGGEFPGARGWMSYTNDIARLDFDFTKGGNYVTMRAGRVADGAKKFSGLFRCKCDGAEKINLRLRGLDAKGDFYVIGTSLSPDGEWREVSFDLARLGWRRGKSTNAADRAAVKWPMDNLEISCEPLPRKLAGFLEVKDLRLATAAEAAEQADWTFSLRAPTGVDSLVYPGGSFVLPYALKSLRVDGGEMSARLVRALVTDGTGKTVCDIPLSDAEGALSLDGDALGGRFGAFRAGVFGVDAAGREREFGATWFARLAGKSKPVAWCGTGVHGWRRAGRYRMIAAAGIGMVRTGSVWDDWEKERGVYACPDNGLREALDEMHSLGIQVNALIYSRANRFYGEPLTEDMDCVWATPDRVRAGWRTLDEDAFCNWVRHFVTHEGRGADFYEIWNEPWNFYFGRFYSYSKKTGHHHDDETWIRKFAAFSRKVADAIREVRPEANVGVCSEDGDGSGLERMLRAGIARKDDCVTFHPYIHLNDPRPERFGFFFADDGARIKAAQAANGGSTRLRITEVGWTTYELDENGKSEHWFVGGYPSVTYAEQADYLIRAYLLARSFGVESMMQYDFSDDGRRRNYTEHNFGMVFQNLTPKPSYAAIAFMTHLLGEATPLGRNFGSDKKTHRIVGFDLPDGRRAYAAWAVEEPVSVPLPEGLEGKAIAVYDIYGNPIGPESPDKLALTESPIYVIGSFQPLRSDTARVVEGEK